MSKLGERVKGR